MRDTAAVPTSGNSMGKAVRRGLLFERAKDALGGAAKLGDEIGCGRRAVNHKLANDRMLTDRELRLAATAVERRARELDQLVADLRQVAA